MNSLRVVTILKVCGISILLIISLLSSLKGRLNSYIWNKFVYYSLNESKPFGSSPLNSWTTRSLFNYSDSLGHSFSEMVYRNEFNISNSTTEDRVVIACINL